MIPRSGNYLVDMEDDRQDEEIKNQREEGVWDEEEFVI